MDGEKRPTRGWLTSVNKHILAPVKTCRLETFFAMSIKTCPCAQLSSLLAVSTRPRIGAETSPHVCEPSPSPREIFNVIRRATMLQTSRFF